MPTQTWSPICKEIAKELKRPLVAITIDGKFCDPPQGKMVAHLNTTPELAKQLHELFLKMMKQNNE